MLRTSAETEAVPALRAVETLIDLSEDFEDGLERAWRDADTGVLDLRGRALEADAHLAARGRVLDGVGEEVGEHLELDGIAAERHLAMSHAGHVEQVVHHAGQLRRLAVEDVDLARGRDLGVPRTADDIRGARPRRPRASSGHEPSGRERVTLPQLLGELPTAFERCAPGGRARRRTGKSDHGGWWTTSSTSAGSAPAAAAPRSRAPRRPPPSHGARDRLPSGNRSPWSLRARASEG